MKDIFEWCIFYLIYFATLTIYRHLFGFEDTVIIGLAWIMANNTADTFQ